MAFIVEDGSGKKGATSYATVQGFKDHFADRNVDVSSITDPSIQALLVAATDYIDTRWGLRFLGRRKFLSMSSRSVLTLTGLPIAEETVTIGTQVYTFKTTPDPLVLTEVEIGTTAIKSLAILVAAVSADTDQDQVADYLFADTDVAALTIYFVEDGIVTLETLTNGSFDLALSGNESSKQQPLEFPRVSLRDRTGELVISVPDRVKEATYEYGFRANTAALAPDVTTHESGLRLTNERTKVGPIETEVRFAEETSVTITKPYPAADRLLQEYVRKGGVIRA